MARLGLQRGVAVRGLPGQPYQPRDRRRRPQPRRDILLAQGKQSVPSF